MNAQSPYSTVVPNWQTVWDSTSLGWLKECPALYRYQMLLKWTPRTKGIHLMFGQLYAGGVEQYAKKRAEGMSHDDATRHMVRWALEHAGTRDESGRWRPWDPDKEQFPHKDANVKNRYTLIRSLVWNVEDRKGTPYKTYIRADGRPAVELSFNFPAFPIGGEMIHLAGHLDEVVEERGTSNLYVKDDKTTKGALSAHYFRQYTPNNQMSLYSVAGRVILHKPIAGVLVRAAQILVEGTRFATQLVGRTPGVLDEWLDDTRFWVSQAKVFAETEHWPHNDKSCGNYGGCAFQDVCARSPKQRGGWLKDGFVKHEWNPLDSREG